MNEEGAQAHEWLRSGGWPLNCDVLPLTIKGASRFLPCTAALPSRFHLPARALGYRPVMDYRAGQLGIQASTGGARLRDYLPDR